MCNKIRKHVFRSSCERTHSKKQTNSCQIFKIKIFIVSQKIRIEKKKNLLYYEELLVKAKKLLPDTFLPDILKDLFRLIWTQMVKCKLLSRCIDL